MSKPSRVCIVGGGPQGLAALKNLLELNDGDSPVFEVELLESRDCIGGKWGYTKDPDEVTALPGTRQNTCRFRNCFTDFPVLDAWRAGGRDGSIPLHLTQEQTAFYLEEYARRFDLVKHIRFGWKANKLQRNEERGQWEVEIHHAQSGQTEHNLYDKVIVASGQHNIPVVPQIEGMENFKGKAVHSKEFKNNEPFKDQTVLIVGSSNTAGDLCTEVAGVAKSVILSHRRGITIAPRIFQNKPLDLMLTRRFEIVRLGLIAFAPAYMTSKMEPFLKQLCVDAWKGRIKPEWNLSPETAPSVSFTPPMISDTMIPLLEADAVQLVPGIKRINEKGEVEFQDGQVAAVDTIIFCTGYSLDPSLSTPVERSGDLQLPRLYQKLYHPEYPTSLAYLTFWHTVAGICELGDLAAMGIAQVFSGRYTLPSRARMEKQIETSHAFVNALAARAPKPISLSAAAQCLDQGPWLTFLHETAGTEVDAKLGYGWQGWSFWWSDREFCNLLMTGVNSIHTARLFKGRPGSRKQWIGAKRAIIEANEEANEAERRFKEEEKAQKAKTV